MLYKTKIIQKIKGFHKMSGNKDILFLNRAYNDLDTQLPLIDSIANDGIYNIKVIGYPCDGDMGSPSYHEAYTYIKDKYNITFETVLDKPPAPIYLRLMYKIERFLFRLKNKKIFKIWPVHFFIKIIHVGLLMLMRHILKKDNPWLNKVTKTWDPAIIILDEAFIQTGRSYMIDKILPEKIKQGSKIYIIQTGQMTYLDTSPNKATKSIIKDLPKSKSHCFIVPSKLDQITVNTNFPLETPEIHGNLRMDKAWIKKLSKEILTPPYFDKQKYLSSLPEGKPRVVFMLSKLGYGIKLDEMKETIRAVANISDIACAIKPHTRGMRFDFMNQQEIKNCAIVPEIPSTILIEWADIILFTGSTIAFHALIHGKRVGFLQNCQYLQTIFDSGEACDKFDTIDQLIKFLKDWHKNGEPKLSIKESINRENWQLKHIYANINNGNTASHYKKIIGLSTNNKKLY